jgi:hypothetical protein
VPCFSGKYRNIALEGGVDSKLREWNARIRPERDCTGLSIIRHHQLSKDNIHRREKNNWTPVPDIGQMVRQTDRLTVECNVILTFIELLQSCSFQKWGDFSWGFGEFGNRVQGERPHLEASTK